MTHVNRRERPPEPDTTPLPSPLGPAPRLHDQLCFAIYATSHAFSRRYKPLLAALNLTYPQYLCLLVLWETNDVTVSALGTELHLDSGTLTPLLKRLERAGLVRRVRDTRDERQVRIQLTAEGWALQPAAASLMEEIICATGRDRDEVDLLRRQLNELRHHMDRKD